MESSKPYGCHNEPRDAIAFYDIQVGWTPDGRRIVRPWPVLPSVARCLYDHNTDDIRCRGCQWITKGEQP